MPQSIAEQWSRIIAWFEENAPEKLDDLEPPATDEEIAATEKRLGFPLPDSLRTFYSLQNGTIEFGVFPSLETDDMPYGPMPLEHIKIFDDIMEDEEIIEFDVRDPQIRPQYWNPRWIPFATNGGGDYHVCDLDPAEGGTVGQIFEWRHETSELLLIAPSLEAALDDILEGLESGRYE
jgi:cell wall assembly regulator SMI1